MVILAGSGLMLLRGGMAESGVWLFFGLLTAATLIAGVLTGGMLYRTLFYLPNFTAGVATFVLWKKLYNHDTGPINQALAPLLDQFSAWVRSMPMMRRMESAMRRGTAMRSTMTSMGRPSSRRPRW